MAANPALAKAQQSKPVEVHAKSASCAFQFDPVGTRRFDSSCDIAKSLLASTGISYTNREYESDKTIIAVGVQQIEVPDGRGLDATGLKALKETTAKEVKAALASEGYPAKAEPGQMNLPVIFLWLMVFAIASTALDGSAGRGARRDVPDPHPLHGDVLPLSLRDGLGRRLPAGRQPRARDHYGECLRQLVVCDLLHGPADPGVAVFPQGNARKAAGRHLTGALVSADVEGEIIEWRGSKVCRGDRVSVSPWIEGH